MLKKIILISLLFSAVLPAQSLNGLSGNYNIPIADVPNDRSISLGLNYIARQGLNYGGHKYDLVNYFFTLAYLPNLELSFRINALQNVGGNYTWDRMFSFKYRFLKENDLFPSIAIGLHNPYSTGAVEDVSHHFNSTYIVATKTIKGIPFIQGIKITAGYGDDFIRSDDYQYIGFFGGISAQINFDAAGKGYMEYMLEHDAERFNTGIRLKLFNHISLLGGFLGFKYPCGGASVSFSL